MTTATTVRCEMTVPLDGFVCGGGAETVRQALAAGLIDELHLHIAPVLLGQGTRLFDEQPDRIVELERFRVVDGADATHLGFRIPRTDADPAQEA